MDLIHHFLDFFLHLDRYLDQWVVAYGAWVYFILFVIVFCETGLVVTPLLPGDSLLFAAGAISALSPAILIPVLIAAALAGDNVNYFIGRTVGPRVFNRPRSWFFNPNHLRRTQVFFEHHGRKTIILARFIPIIRTFSPFVAGIGAMRYRTFLLFSFVGASLWVPLGVICGHLFGQLPWVKKNFSLVILAIVFISLMPPLIEYLRSRGRRSTTIGH